MDVLPLDHIRDEDAPVVGSAIVKLARLYHSGFPVERGVVVTSPDFRLKTILKHYNLKDKEIFEQSLTIIKKEILNIPTPPTLSEYFKESRKIDPSKLWLQLLEVWVNEIREKVWKGGLGGGPTLGLSAQPVFTVSNISGSGKAYFDELRDEVVVEIEKGVYSEGLRQTIEKTVLEANKRLMIPQVYHFILTGKEPTFKIINLTPYTPNYEREKIVEQDDIVVPKVSPQREVYRSNAVKILLELSSSFAVHKGVNGVFINSEKYKDFDEKVFALVESAHSYSEGKVIFKLSDEIEQRGGVRGSLRLNHQESLLKRDMEVFLFARNKKRLLNVEVCVPFVRSVEEFLQIKRNLASAGISRKGSLKLWMEACVPENIINLEDYLVAGLDGVVMNLDELSSLIGGFDPSVPESVFYKKQLQAMIKFLEDPLKLLHTSGVPVVLRGKLALEDEFLKLSVSKGIYALVADFVSSASLGEHLSYLEKRHIRLNS